MSENRWEGIDEFVAVAECSQFTAAAERLGVSSRMSVDKSYAWRERLQTRLLYRSTRRVTLTEAGQTFFATLPALAGWSRRGVAGGR